MGASATLNPLFKPNIQFPAFVPNNIGALTSSSATQDKNAIIATDAEFNANNPMLAQAQRAQQNQTAQDFSGNNTFIPQLQATAIQSGLEGATASMGPMTANLPNNSGVQADVAKNLGENIQQFQQQQRQNSAADINLAEQISPHQQVGMTGADTAELQMLNTAGTNNWNQANYANTLGLNQFNYLVGVSNKQAQAQQANNNAMASAAQSSAIWNGVFQSLGGLVGAAGNAAGSGML